MGSKSMRSAASEAAFQVGYKGTKSLIKDDLRAKLDVDSRAQASEQWSTSAKLQAANARYWNAERVKY